jgi:hypothetical protein
MPRMDEWAGQHGQKWRFAPWCLAVLVFILFARYRVRFGGGCDSSSYLLESLRIRGSAPGLRLDPTVPFQGPLAPLCMVLHDGLVSSFFPPGFPLLLALAGSMGFPFLVTPLLGAASGLALFYLVRPRLGRAVALGTMAAWMGSPLVFWGSTQVMSDFPAAAFAIFSVLALSRGRPLLSGALLGFSLGIRPTQALLAPVLVLVEPKLRTQAQVLAGAALAVVGWAIFLRLSRGAVFLPYTDDLSSLDGAAFGAQLHFLLWQTWTLHLPVVALALVGLAARPSRVLPYAIWFGSFLLLYSMWHWPFDAWWWMRYMLPALPALFLAAAEGAATLATWLGPQRRAVSTVAGVAIITAYAAWTLFVSPAKDHLIDTFDEYYARDAAYMSRTVPEGSLVGAMNQSGTLRLYARFQTFFWCHRETAALIRWAVSVQRPVYLVLDDTESSCNPEARAAAQKYASTAIVRLPSGKPLRRLDPPDGLTPPPKNR